jgi:hypothetical protein
MILIDRSRRQKPMGDYPADLVNYPTPFFEEITSRDSKKYSKKINKKVPFLPIGFRNGQSGIKLGGPFFEGNKQPLYKYDEG